MLVHLCLGDESAAHRLRNALIDIAPATLDIGAGQSADCSGMDRIGRRFVVLPEVAHSTAVADDEILETPFVAKNLLKQTGIATARLIVQTLIGTHHLAHICLGHQRLESRQIGFPQVARRHIGEVGGVACVFWTAVHGIVFGTSPEFAVLGIFGTLKPTHDSLAHLGHEVRVFAVGFLSTSPTWVTEDVDVGRPD